MPDRNKSDDTMRDNAPGASRHDAWLDDRIEAFVDGTLPPGEQDRFESALRVSATLRDDVALARLIGEELPSLGTVKCPDHVVPGVMREVRRDIRSSFASRFAAALRQGIQPRLRPVLAMVLLLAVVVSSSLVRRAPEPAPVASAEVIRALDEVKWSLAVLSDAGRQMGRSVRSDVIEPHVVEPIERSLNQVIQ
ncbi:MAG: hypothetical protein HKN17_04000 [Rhodothermales bacterium]|nr:hypothetical protein [Rhodothermales bacterium]